MTWYPDGSPWTDVPSRATSPLIAIGWLDEAHPFPKGPVTAEQFEKLFALAVDPWQPFAFGRGHACAFCRFSGGAGSVM